MRQTTLRRITLRDIAMFIPTPTLPLGRDVSDISSPEVEAYTNIVSVKPWPKNSLQGC